MNGPKKTSSSRAKKTSAAGKKAAAAKKRPAPPPPRRPAAPPVEEPMPVSRRAAVVAEAARASAKASAKAKGGDADEDDDIETTRVALPRPSGVLTPPPAVVAQIRELEAQLDRLIDEASRRDVSALDPEPDDGDDAPTSSERIIDEDLEVTRDALPGSLRVAVESRPSVPEPRPSLRDLAPPSEATVFDTARELLSTDFYLRKWGRLAMRGRSEEVDDFGFDPIYESKLRGVLEFLYSRYFRVQTTGIDRVPAQGRCVLVANHSGTVPLDGVMLKTAVKLEHPSGRDLRWLTEDFIYHMPYLGSMMNRLGGVRACQENAERLLAKEQLVAVFPEGVKGIGKLFSERYRLQRFGRGGFIKLCLRTGTPIVPVAVVGAEETNPLLFRFEYLSKALGLPYVPVTPTFPLLGPLGLLPAPTKWTIEFGEPLDFSGHGPEAADDELLVGRLAERVRATIQGMLDRGVGARKSVFFG
jgi:1-acyl-sn-glycerol-3-phosphate acyltransferase